jgi:hypothetical protein
VPYGCASSTLARGTRFISARGGIGIRDLPKICRGGGIGIRDSLRSYARKSVRVQVPPTAQIRRVSVRAWEFESPRAHHVKRGSPVRRDTRPLSSVGRDARQKFGLVAQLEERTVYIRKVPGSRPGKPTKFRREAGGSKPSAVTLIAEVAKVVTARV